MTANAKFWDDIAVKYAAQPVGNATAFDRKKAITREHMRPGGNILEIGCGTGSLALELSPLAGHVHALDISAEMIRIANDKKAQQGVRNVTFQQGALEPGTPFAPAQFDAIWAYSILHLVEDRSWTLKKIFELMKPGGSLISSNVCLAGTWVPYGVLITVMRWFGKAPVVYRHDRETIMREMREAGFVDVGEKDVGTGKTVAFIVARKPA